MNNGIKDKKKEMIPVRGIRYNSKPIIFPFTRGAFRSHKKDSVNVNVIFVYLYRCLQ